VTVLRQPFSHGAQVNSAFHPSGVDKLVLAIRRGKGVRIVAVEWQVILCDPTKCGMTRGWRFDQSASFHTFDFTFYFPYSAFHNSALYPLPKFAKSASNFMGLK